MKLFKYLHESGIPKPIKVLLYITLIVTCVYWIGTIIYYVLEALRWVLHNATDKKLWWITLCIILACVITVLCLMQYKWGLNPFGKFMEWLNNLIDNIRESMSNKINPNK